MSLCYHAPTKRFTVSQTEISQAAAGFMFALKMIRQAAGLPMTAYERREGMLTVHDHAQKAIIDAARHIGIDLGGLWGNEIDVSSAG